MGRILTIRYINFLLNFIIVLIIVLITMSFISSIYRYDTLYKYVCHNIEEYFSLVKENQHEIVQSFLGSPQTNALIFCRNLFMKTVHVYLYYYGLILVYVQVLLFTLLNKKTIAKFNLSLSKNFLDVANKTKVEGIRAYKQLISLVKQDILTNSIKLTKTYYTVSNIWLIFFVAYLVILSFAVYVTSFDNLPASNFFSQFRPMVFYILLLLFLYTVWGKDVLNQLGVHKETSQMVCILSMITLWSFMSLTTFEFKFIVSFIMILLIIVVLNQIKKGNSISIESNNIYFYNLLILAIALITISPNNNSILSIFTENIYSIELKKSLTSFLGDNLLYQEIQKIKIDEFATEITGNFHTILDNMYFILFLPIFFSDVGIDKLINYLIKIKNKNFDPATEDISEIKKSVCRNCGLFKETFGKGLCMDCFKHIETSVKSINYLKENKFNKIIKKYNMINDLTIKTFTQKNFKYYTTVWKKSENAFFLKVNWCALFFTFEWLLYRKMYVLAILYNYVVPLVIFVLFPDVIYFVVFSVLLPRFVFFIFGNTFYRMKFLKTLEAANDMDQLKTLELLKLKGGTNVFIIIILYLVLPILLAFLQTLFRFI